MLPLAVSRAGPRYGAPRDEPGRERSPNQPFEALHAGLETLEREMEQAEKAWSERIAEAASDLEAAMAKYEDAKAREAAAERKLAALRDLLKEG